MSNRNSMTLTAKKQMTGYEYNRRVVNRRRFRSITRYILLSIVAFFMLYPVLWLFGASFKTNTEIFTSVSFIPNNLDFTSFVNGWNTGTGHTFTTFFINTFIMVVPQVIFALVTVTLVSYGFARFNFPFKKLLFSMVVATLFLPGVVTRIPLFMMWRDMGQLNTYVPLIAPSFFGQEPFFIFMMVQFLRGIPKEYDEAAKIDGCSSFKTLTMVLLPLLKPAMITVILFRFIWSYNSFMEPLIYITSVSRFPVSVALRTAMDLAGGITPWNQTIAMSFIALIPCIIVFFVAQKYFVDGLSAGGLKG